MLIINKIYLSYNGAFAAAAAARILSVILTNTQHNTRQRAGPFGSNCVYMRACVRVFVCCRVVDIDSKLFKCGLLTTKE